MFESHRPPGCVFATPWKYTLSKGYTGVVRRRMVERAAKKVHRSRAERWRPLPIFRCCCSSFGSKCNRDEQCEPSTNASTFRSLEDEREGRSRRRRRCRHRGKRDDPVLLFFAFLSFSLDWPPLNLRLLSSDIVSTRPSWPWKRRFRLAHEADTEDFVPAAAGR